MKEIIRLKLSADQSVTSGVVTIIAWNTLNFQSGTQKLFGDLVNNKVVVRAKGLYKVGLNFCGWSGSDSHTRTYAKLLINGVNPFPSPIIDIPSPAVSQAASYGEAYLDLESGAEIQAQGLLVGTSPNFDVLSCALTVETTE